MRITALTFALLLGVSGAALAATGNDSPNDDNSGKGNDGSTHEGSGTGNGHPGGSGPGQSWLDGSFVVATHDRDHENPDADEGGGNDPNDKAPGQTTNPNPGKLFDDTPPVWLEGFEVASDNTAPGSGNWGGGPGNSGPGDKNGQNAGSNDGGQAPNDDK